jgi:pyruvate dehydrogenase E1 component alpha subunit
MDTVALRSSLPADGLAAMRDDGSVGPEHLLVEELAVALYEHMVLARALCKRVAQLAADTDRPDAGAELAHLGGGPPTGDEATVVGAVAAMNDDDWVFPGSRGVAAALWRGMPLAATMHHVLATARDAGKGRSAPESPFWRDARVVSVSSLVGTQISHAVGVAWAARMRSNDEAALVFFGEDAAGSGDFHAGLNFAGVSRAPLVAVCRSRPPRGALAPGVAVLARKAIAYGLRGVAVDGGDVVAVLAVVREARRRAAAGLGATLVEAIVADGADPIARMRGHLEWRNLWNPDRDAGLRSEVLADIDRAVAEASSAGKPARDTMFDDVFAELAWPQRDQRGERGPPAPRDR